MMWYWLNSLFGSGPRRILCHQPNPRHIRQHHGKRHQRLRRRSELLHGPDRPLWRLFRSPIRSAHFEDLFHNKTLPWGLPVRQPLQVRLPDEAGGPAVDPHRLGYAEWRENGEALAGPGNPTAFPVHGCEGPFRWGWGVQGDGMGGAVGATRGGSVATHFWLNYFADLLSC